MRLKLILSLLFFYIIANAQTNTELKDFINKNQSAIIYIHKNVASNHLEQHSDIVKYLLKKQLTNILIYSKDKELAVSMAVDIRNNCLNVIKNYIKQPASQFEFTSAEKNYKIFPSKANQELLSEEVLNSIKKLNVLDENALTKFTISIQ
jgi:septum formation topological specificity factor MinE